MTRLSNWMKRYFQFLTIILLVAFLSFILGGLGSDQKTENEASAYPFLAPRLFAKESNDLIINFTQLREVMRARHAEKKLNLGVYFEYLPTGSSIGINDQFEVELGSLGKVPAVMATYKNIEDGVINGNTLLVVEQKHLDDQSGELWRKGLGTEITVDEAIELALVDSDNTAINLLLDKIDEETQDAVFDRLDLPKITDGLYPIMSPKSYASVFRNLYLSSYLENENSNLILGLLSRTKFNDKIPAGLPKNTVMSHKIGIFTNENETVYNDCGIVYLPNRPYVLCIMAAAEEAVAREEMIAYSKMVYSYVAQVNPSRQME